MKPTVRIACDDTSSRYRWTIQCAECGADLKARRIELVIDPGENPRPPFVDIRLHSATLSYVGTVDVCHAPLPRAIEAVLPPLRGWRWAVRCWWRATAARLGWARA